MSPEEKELLKRTLVLAEENNDMLRSIKRSMRLQRYVRIVYWIFLIGSAVGAFYLLQPYIDQVKSLYGGASDIFSSFQ